MSDNDITTERIGSLTIRVDIEPRDDGWQAYWRVFDADGDEIEDVTICANSSAQIERLAGEYTSRVRRIVEAGGSIAPRVANEIAAARHRLANARIAGNRLDEARIAASLETLEEVQRWLREASVS